MGRGGGENAQFRKTLLPCPCMLTAGPAARLAPGNRPFKCFDCLFQLKGGTAPLIRN